MYPSLEQEVQDLVNLHWHNLTANELQQLIFLSAAAAEEFADSLRIALRLFPDDKGLQLMAEKELNTTNLTRNNFTQGDHAGFLRHLIKRYWLVSDTLTKNSCAWYLRATGSSDELQRALSVIHRRKTLQTIFQKILQAPDWSLPGLDDFRYYLEQHLELPAGEHAKTTEEIVHTNPLALARFYSARRHLYTSSHELLPSLLQY